jgi:hypothetical protein
MSAEERERALKALAGLDSIPATSPDRIGHRMVFRKARIIKALQESLRHPVAAYHVYWALARDGYIGKARVTSRTDETGNHDSFQVAHFDVYGALDALRAIRQRVEDEARHADMTKQAERSLVDAYQRQTENYPNCGSCRN